MSTVCYSGTSPSMRCTIPGRGIRAFGKAILCLAKIGDELYIEAEPDGLALKTTNGARSAYACFLFQRSFFHSYSDRRGGARGRGDEEEEEEEQEALKCKITIKSIFSVFRALSTLEKTVDHCRLHLDPEENKLVFIFNCRHGIVKTHQLGYQECEALQAVFTKDLSPNHIAGPARILSEVVTNFPTNLEEVTLTADPERTQLRNYIEDEGDGMRVPITEICLLPAEFDEYQIGVDASVTFCLRELRAILLFTDAINHCLSLRFETAGKPIVFSLDDCKEYHADFVLATLPDSTTSPSQPHTSLAHSTTATRKVQNGRHHRAEVANSSVALREYSTMLEEEDTMDDFTDVCVPPAIHKGKHAGAGNHSSTHESNWTSATATNTSSNSRRNFSQPTTCPKTAHVPTPPQDTFMDTEYQEPSSTFSRTNPRTQNKGYGGSRGAGAGEDYDVMDALFEAENLNDIAKDRDTFKVAHGGWKGGGSKGKERASGTTRGQKTKSKLCAGGEKRMDTSEGSQLQDKFGAHDFPHEDVFEATAKRTALPDTSGTHDQTRDHTEYGVQWSDDGKMAESSDHPTAAIWQRDTDLTQADHNITQDSIINDSGFIPSTPPAKKFKSILFGVDMFGDRSNKSEILAPDSDEEGN